MKALSQHTHHFLLHSTLPFPLLVVLIPKQHLLSFGSTLSSGGKWERGKEELACGPTSRFLPFRGRHVVAPSLRTCFSSRAPRLLFFSFERYFFPWAYSSHLISPLRMKLKQRVLGLGFLFPLWPPRQNQRFLRFKSETAMEPPPPLLAWVPPTAMISLRFSNFRTYFTILGQNRFC